LGTTLFGAALVGIYLLLHAGVMRLLGAPWAALAVVTLVCAGCVFGLAKKVKIL